MTIIRDLFALLGTAIIMVCQCGADRPLPEVTGVSYKWIDPFVLKMHWSWMRPEALPKSCQVQFSVKGENKDKATTERLNTREEHVDMCYLTKSPATTRIYIHVCPENCSGWTISQTVNKTIEEPNNAELVKDFKCVMKSYNMTWNCTWTPAHPSLKLDVSYRKSGKTEKDLNRLTTCREFITTGEQRGCHVHTDPQDIWVLAKTDSQRHIFKPRLVVPLPNVTLKEDGPLLRVTWHPPKVGRSCKWILNVWYEACHNTETLKERDNFTIPYDSCCVYKLRYNVSTDKDCLEVSSDNSPILTYGQPCFSVAIALTVIIPIIVFIFVLLSCYCFRRYKDIICPIVPEPLDLFKGLVTGNRDMMVPVVPLYQPVESIQSCKITLIPENKPCQENE